MQQLIRTFERIGGAIHPRLRWWLRGLGWLAATLALLVVLGALGEIVSMFVHGAWLATCITITLQGILVALLAVALRRVVVPNPVWIGLVINGLFNVWAVAAMGFVIYLLMKNSPDVGQMFIATSKYPGDAAGLVLRATKQVPEFLVAAAAWSLSPGGKVFRTRRSQVGFAAFVVVLTAFVLLNSWYLVAGAYAFASISGRNERVRAGDSVELIGRAGTIMVPSGWGGEVNTAASPPPRWFPVPPGWDLSPAPVAQSAVLTPTAQHSAPAAHRSDKVFIFVYGVRQNWLDRLAVARRNGTRFPLAEESFAASGVVAYSNTATSTSGGWRTTVNVFIPSATTPAVMVLWIPQGSSVATPTAVIRERLRWFRPGAGGYP